MGTNYFWHVKTCSKCGHPKETYHIGKSSGGWTFSFQALQDFESPTNQPIRSVKDWKKAMAETKGIIVDEYGERIARKAFWALVEAKRKRVGAKIHAVEAQHHDWYRGSQDRAWLDDEGHSFSSGHFS